MIRDGKIVYEEYPRMRPHDKHIWWSVSKSIVGTIVGLLEEQGLVDVSKPIETYVPELTKSKWKDKNIVALLTEPEPIVRRHALSALCLVCTKEEIQSYAKGASGWHAVKQRNTEDLWLGEP